jgi:8-oxo-dGTP pyrophosphatase MutT (NUDIX family)
VLLSKDGKLLLAFKDPRVGGVYPGTWGIIGGGIDEAEDERTALNREMLEETGIDISSYLAELVFESTGESEKTLRDTDERVFVKMNFHTYRVVMDDKNADEILVTLDEEHSDYRWCDPTELKNIQLPPPSVELFKKLGYL